MTNEKGYADPDGINAPELGSRSDGQDKEAQVLIRERRTLMSAIDSFALATTHIDVTCDTDGQDPLVGMDAWVTFKTDNRDQVSFLAEQRKAALGNNGERIGSTTGTYETSTLETKEQVHTATVPVGGPDDDGNHRTALALCVWEFHPERPERQRDGSVSTFPAWEIEPDFDAGVVGVAHGRAGQPVTMWRLARVSILDEEMDPAPALDALFDDVAAAMQSVRAGRRKDIKQAANEAPHKFKGSFDNVGS